MIQRRPILAIRKARKAFGSKQALRGVSLELHEGELLGFLGPNGAGKTTLIRCLSGRTRLDSGTIAFNSGLAANQLLGIVPQSIALYEDLTAEQNLLAFGRLQGLRGRALRSEVADALEWSNLLDRRRHFVSSFSGGMKRRLNIACSVLHRPKVLLLDEPTVGVDPQSRERIYKMLADLRAQGAAILLTTHHLEEAQFRCDRIAIVDRGKVIRTGSIDELIADTVGQQQQLTITFGRIPAPNALTCDRFDAERRQANWMVQNAAVELPQIMTRLREKGARIDHVVLQSSTLQDVFLHLTGQELRE